MDARIGVTVAPGLRALAAEVLAACRARGLMLATAESCTGGLLSGVLTAVPGASDVVERGFVTYSYASKSELLGVDPALIIRDGAVSEAVARAMAEGALARSHADLAVAVTGVAGPGSDSQAKPAGLVWLACAGHGTATLAEVHRFGDSGRDLVRAMSVEAALRLVLRLVPETVARPPNRRELK
jgi:nicotinamide-nucleotide amidase